MYEYYAKIRDSKGLKDLDVSKGTGIAPGTLSDWKSGRIKHLKAEKLRLIADFFDVSVDYLLTGQHPEQQAQAFANSLAAEMKPKAVKNYIGLVKSAVRFAGGTFPQVTLPRWELHSDFVPSEEAMHLIMAEVSGTRLEIPVALGMMGLRRSEVCGLSPEDMEGNTLHVHSAAVYGIDNQIHQKGTKTAGSERWISIPEPLADKIRAEGMPDLSLHALSAAFRRIVKRLHLEPFRFHDLRHFFVSYCHNVLHLSDAQIMKLGGYTTDSVMKRHYRQSMNDKKSADRVADALTAFVT